MTRHFLGCIGTIILCAGAIAVFVKRRLRTENFAKAPDKKTDRTGSSPTEEPISSEEQPALKKDVVLNDVKKDVAESISERHSFANDEIRKSFEHIINNSGDGDKPAEQ